MSEFKRQAGRILVVGKQVFSPIGVLLLGLGYLLLLLLLGTSSPFLVVRGVSMLPTYHHGDLLLNRSVVATQIRVGDVLAFAVPEDSRAKLKLAPVVAHRVIDIQGAGGQLVFITKGDNTEVDPFKVPAALVKGRVVADLGPLGHPILFLSQKKVWLYLGLPLLVFAVVVAATLALSPRQRAAPAAPAQPSPRLPTAEEARKILPQFIPQHTAPDSGRVRVPRTPRVMVKSLQEATEELSRVIADSGQSPQNLIQAMRRQDVVLYQLKAYVNDPREFQQSEELEQAINGFTDALGRLEGLTRVASVKRGGESLPPNRSAPDRVS